MKNNHNMHLYALDCPKSLTTTIWKFHTFEKSSGPKWIVSIHVSRPRQHDRRFSSAQQRRHWTRFPSRFIRQFHNRTSHIEPKIFIHKTTTSSNTISIAIHPTIPHQTQSRRTGLGSASSCSHSRELDPQQQSSSQANARFIPLIITIP